MNRHSRKNGGKPGCQHVPEEVSHGENLLSEERPTAATYPRIPRKAILIITSPGHVSAWPGFSLLGTPLLSPL